LSKTEELIAQYCPDGVEFLKIEEVLLSLKTGLNPRKNFKLNTGDALNYYVTIREIVGHNIKFHEKTDRVNDEGLRLINNRSNLEKYDILFSGTGTIGRVALVKEDPTNWNVKEGVYILKPNRLKIVPSFLLYLLNAPNTISLINNKIVGSPVCSVPMSDLKKISIPVPPLPVQEEIVNILDKFTSLEAELKAELKARTRQYEYYRNQLLAFEGKEIEWKALGDIGEFIRGKRFVRTDMIEEGFPCIHYGEMYTHYNVFATESKSFISEELAKKLRVAKKGDVVIVAAGETIEDIGKATAWLGESDVVTHDACFTFRSSLNPKFVAYFSRTKLFHDQIKKHISSGKISAINAKGLEKAKIPVPSLEEQERIVDILDEFDTLVNDISVGLPAEIKARRQQYEYYRGKLLTFEPLIA
jgi:type I restriction enzyme S subunit